MEVQDMGCRPIDDLHAVKLHLVEMRLSFLGAGCVRVCDDTSQDGLDHITRGRRTNSRDQAFECSSLPDMTKAPSL